VSADEVLTGRASWALVHGEALQLLRSLPSASVDAVITDPPYSSGGFTRGDRMGASGSKYVQNGTILQRPYFAGDNRDQRSFRYWCAMWLAECLRVAKPGAPICVFADWRQLPTATDAIQAGGWVWRGIVVWDKTDGSRPQLGRFNAQCEYVAWGTSGASPDLEEIGCLRGLVSEPARRDKHHQTGKPTAVMRHLVRICPRGGVVLDPFAGSATTGVAAIIEGRRFLGFELTEEYAVIGRDRLAATVQGVDFEAFRMGQLPLFPVPDDDELQEACAP